VELTKKWNK